MVGIYARSVYGQIELLPGCMIPKGGVRRGRRSSSVTVVYEVHIVVFNAETL